MDPSLEGDGFELPVRGRGQSVCRPFCCTRLLKVAAGDAEPQETTRAFSGVSGSRATLHKRMWLEGRLERPRTIFPSPQSAVSTASAHLTSLRSESIDHMLVKHSGGYIRNHRPSEQRRLSRLRQRPGRSARCRPVPATGRVKRHDNQLHRARVLEVRIQSPPAESRTNVDRGLRIGRY